LNVPYERETRGEGKGNQSKKIHFQEMTQGEAGGRKERKRLAFTEVANFPGSRETPVSNGKNFPTHLGKEGDSVSREGGKKNHRGREWEEKESGGGNGDGL